MSDYQEKHEGKKRTQQKLTDDAFDKVLMIGTGENISLSLIMT